MSPARRPRLFSFSREIELSTIEGWARPEERPLLESVVDAFLEVTRTRQLTGPRLAPVVEACGHPSANVRSTGLSRLVVMAHYFEHAKEALRELAVHPSADVRATAASSLANAPEDLLLPQLERHLEDESSSVRRAAARLALTHSSVPGLVPVLERAMARESETSLLQLLDKAVAKQRAFEG